MTSATTEGRLMRMNPCPQAHCGGSLIPARYVLGRLSCTLCARTDGVRLPEPARLADVDPGRAYVAHKGQRLGTRREAAA